MDDSLRLIQHLYDEDVDDPTFDRRLAEDDQLREEYERLQATKNALDRRSPPSPDPATVDQVVARAADAAQNGTATNDQNEGRPERAPDRAAQSPDRTWSRRIRGVSTGLALLLIVGLGVWQLRSGGATTADSSPSEPTTQQQSTSVAAGAEQEQGAESIPEWDDRDEVVRLHQRIEHVRSRSRTDTWGGDLQTVDQTSP
jgi:hypothetical protein